MQQPEQTSPTTTILTDVYLKRSTVFSSSIYELVFVFGERKISIPLVESQMLGLKEVIDDAIRESY